MCSSDLNAIKNGVPVAIVGAVNSGKSTLLNVYLSDKYAATDSVRASKIMLDSSGTAYRQFVPSRPSLTIDFFTCRLHHD